MPQASSARILLLEQDPEARNTLREVLQSAGFEVLEVGGAIQALEQALAVPPDLALVSLERPYLEGFRLCQEWQRQERLRQIPFVFLAESDAEPSAEARAVFLGATAVWRKPLDAGLVVEQVRDLLQKDQNLARAEVVPAVAESQKLGEISEQARFEAGSEKSSARLAAAGARSLSVPRTPCTVALETDSKGAIQSVDRAFENVLGWPEELLLGQGVSEVISFGESSGSWNSEEVVAEVLRKGIAVALPPGTYLRAADGTLRAVEGLIAPDRDCSRALFVLRCRELETTSQDSLSRYWALADFVLETCGAGYLVLDRDLKVVRASSNFFERIGFEPEAVIGRSVLDFPGGLFRQEAVLARLREGFVQKTPLESCPVSTTLGKLGDRSFEIAARPLGTGDPPLGLLVVLRDVSHRKRLEQERHEAMVNLERVVEAAPLIFWMCDSSGLIQTSVGGGLKSLGLEPRALVGTHFEEHLAQQPERERLLTAFQEALQGVPQVFDTHYRGRFYRSHFFPHRDAAGNIVGVVGTCLDLTETETLEGALTEAKRNLNAVLHLLPSEIMWLDQEGNVTDVSGPASALLGRSREDILGVPFDGFLSVPSQAVFRELWARQVTGDGLTAELEVKRPDGSTRGVLL